MYTKVQKLNISDLGDICIQKSMDKNVHVEAPESVKVKQDSETLIIKGDGLNSGRITMTGDIVNSIVSVGGSKISGVDIRDHDEFSFGNILRNLFGGFSKNTVTNRVVTGRGSTVTEITTRNGKTTVKVNGKLLSESELEKFKEERKPTVIKIPDGLEVRLQGCSDVVFESDFSFSNLVLEIVGHGELRAKKLCADSATVSFSGHSTSRIDVLDTPVLDLSSDGMSKCVIGAINAPQATLTVSGHSECKIDSLVSENAKMIISSMSRFFVGEGSAKQATIVTSGHSTSKIRSLNASKLTVTSSSMSTLKVDAGKMGRVSFTTSGHSTVKVEGSLQNVVATTSSMSTCKFSKPSESPKISTSGHSTCKVI